MEFFLDVFGKNKEQDAAVKIFRYRSFVFLENQTTE